MSASEKTITQSRLILSVKRKVTELTLAYILSRSTMVEVQREQTTAKFEFRAGREYTLNRHPDVRRGEGGPYPCPSCEPLGIFPRPSPTYRSWWNISKRIEQILSIIRRATNTIQTIGPY